MAERRLVPFRLAVALAVAILAVVDVQSLLQTLRSQRRLRDRVSQSTRDAIFTARPRLVSLLQPGDAEAWRGAAREALASSLGAEVEVFDPEGRRLFSFPGDAPVSHWPSPSELQPVRSGGVVTFGPVTGGGVRLLTYVAFRVADDLRILRIASPCPELAEDLRERREVVLAHALSLVILAAAAGLAFFPRGGGAPSTRGALQAYEEAMARLRERGRELTEEHAEELRRLERQIEDKEALARAGELTAGMAHEVRNGLGTIVGYARLIENEAATRGAVEAARSIREECETLETVVRRFMDFVKHETLNLAAFDLGRLLSRVVSREGRSGSGGEVTLGSVAVASIVGDEELLERAFENLVRNAREAAGRGGHVWVAGVRDGNLVAVTIADDGPGLSGGLKAVRPFATTKTGGLGLGLPMALKMVHLHGGDLVLGERAPHGLVVTVRLPCSGPSGDASGVTVRSANPAPPREDSNGGEVD
ncbi:MAG TPA: HAMP domain-containing sensor histidine kinase [Vicinamibacteria bacterium]